jgi:Reverse transcriptase (RNA-dependent DNA polymerase)
VLSKAINNRLKKISNTILSREQKGFTNKKYIQECLINIIEFAGYCNKTNTPGFILAIDQAKAFDMVSHNFIREVYKFFGFGPKFTKLCAVELLGIVTDVHTPATYLIPVKVCVHTQYLDNG